MKTEKSMKALLRHRGSPRGESLDAAVMARLKAPFDCKFIPAPATADGRSPRADGRWRIADANDDAIASVSGLEEGYAQLIVEALNEHFERRAKKG